MAACCLVKIKCILFEEYRVFIRHWRSKNSLATTQNSPDKFCLFPVRALPFHNNSPVTLQYSPATPILNENPENIKHFVPFLVMSFSGICFVRR